jgi:hypothetical protein
MEEQVVPVEEPQVETPVEEVVEETPKEEPQVETPVEEPPLVIPPPKKKTAQERIDEITRLRREAERERDYYRELATKKETPSPQIPSGRPVISNYETTEAYEDALLVWHDNRRAEQTKAEEIKRRSEDALTRFNEKAKPLREVYEDFDEVIETPVFTPAMRMALLSSDDGPELAYFLGRPENRTIAEKLKNLPVEIQLYELGKLEAKLEVAKKTKKVPSAPPPINPVGMSGKTDVDPAEMSTEEWMAWDRDRTSVV